MAITAVFGWCALQARILVDLVAEKDAHTPGKRPEPNEGRALDTHIATLEEAVAKAEALGEQRCQEAQTAAKRIEALEVHIATLEEAVAKAEALGEQRCQEAQTAAKRVEGLVAALVEMTSETRRDLEADGRADGSNREGTS